MKKCIISLIALCFGIISYSQEKVFSYEEYIEIVKKHHPISYQAGLQIERGEAYVMKAKGGFDPKLGAAIDQKYFKGSQYYSHINSKLVVPTWFGLSAQAGYESNEGIYLNPEFQTPTTGLINAGLSLTLGKGLFIDERRAELKQAKIYQNSTEQEQRIIRNKLIYNASVVYWKWKVSFLKMKVYEEALVNAQVRFEGVKQSVKLGDKPAIDTTEAKITIQNRLIKYEQAKLDFENTRLKLGVYLWQDGFIPLELDSATTPKSELNVELNPTNFNDSIIDNHPELMLYQNKIEIQKIENRLQREGLKPTLNLNYNFLNEQVGENPLPDLNVNNYKWGATFSYPIFIRKERAQVKLSQIMLNETISNTELKRATLNYKIRSSRNNINALSTQLEISNAAVDNYKKLFNSENSLFNIGESNVFMINTREKSYINSQLKNLDIYFKLLKFNQEYSYNLMEF